MSQHVLVTAGAAGIGLAVAQAFAAAGVGTRGQKLAVAAPLPELSGPG